MGIHMRLAEIEKSLLELAKLYDYRDVNFESLPVGNDITKLTISAFAPGDPSVGMQDAEDTFVYKLTTRYDEHGVPTGLAVELMGKLEGEMYGKRIRPVVDDELRVLALDLGNIAARKLFHEILCGGSFNRTTHPVGST